MAQALHRPRLAVSAALLLAAILAGAPGCVIIREMRQVEMTGVVLDAATGRPVPGATLVVRATRFQGSEVEYRRFDADAEGRLRVPARRKWHTNLDEGLFLLSSPPLTWLNEHLYMAPGYAWIQVPVGKSLRGRGPDRVLLTPLARDARRMTLSAAGGKTWTARERWELRVPGCGATAQGLPEGGGIVLYWDAQRVVVASSARTADGGLWLEGVPGLGAIRVIGHASEREGLRAFLDPADCGWRFEE